jgi:hypothetical protein
VRVGIAWYISIFAVIVPDPFGVVRLGSAGIMGAGLDRDGLGFGNVPSRKTGLLIVSGCTCEREKVTAST